MKTYLGIDLGTSGVRACVIDDRGNPLTKAQTPAGTGADPQGWWEAVEQVVAELATAGALAGLEAIAVDGTSGTLLCCDSAGTPLAGPLMYNDLRAGEYAAAIDAAATDERGGRGAGSSLARLLYFRQGLFLAEHAMPLHQADWIAGRLCGDYGFSDAHNALKLGFDPVAHRWPEWLESLGIDRRGLPRVYSPGSTVAPLREDLATCWGLRSGVRIVAGTTDSTAAVIATGACHVGQGVTSLGSTLVVKVLSPRPVFAPAYGIYSHGLGDLWLAGGASNSGGAVLAEFFTPEELARLSAAIDPAADSGLDYYPLSRPGERFPVADAKLAPRLVPRPASDSRFLQGMLEGIARIERQGYERLRELGTPAPRSVLTVGGGAANPVWTAIRSRILGVPVHAADHGEAAYGSALLARGLPVPTQADGVRESGG